MKKGLLTLMTLCLSLSIWAYDFVSYVDGYYYTITSSTAPYTVQVTYETMGTTAAYTGALTIPSTTTNNGITYTVTSIGQLAFFNSGTNGSSYGATSITLPSTITSIGSDAFRGCKKLTTITIPSSVTTISEFAFLNCSSLASVTILSNITAINYNTFEGCSSLESITIPSTVTSIGSSAFYGCVKLTSIAIPSGVTSIASFTFRDCSGLTSITIPSGVTTINQYAFSGCSGLTSITIPSTVTAIYDYAFNGCSSLGTINCLATTPPTVYSTTFSNTSSTVVVPCSSISSYKAASYWSSFSNYSAATFTQDGIRYQPNTSCSEVSVVSNSYSGSLTIPSSVTYNGNTYAVTSIGDNAFYHCTALTSVTIPESVTSIGASAFQLCYSLTSIVLPDNLITIGNYAFSGSNLSSITFPASLTTIGAAAFYNCTNMTSVTIPPSSVTTIGDGAFQACTGLTSITLPSSVTSMGSNTFYNCTGLTSVTLSSSVTSIPANTFYGCTGLKSFTIPSWITYLAEYSFYGCTGLTSVTIPSSVTRINSQAFYNCTGLTSIYTGITMPADAIAGTDIFYNVSKTSCTLHVPTGYLSTYRAAYEWKDFSNIVEPCTWSGSAWSTTPNATSDAVINGNFSTTGFACHDLTVNAGKQVTIASGTLNVSGNITLKSDASGTASLIGTSIVGGTSNAECYMTADAWHIISSPAPDQSVGAFLSSNSTIMDDPTEPTQKAFKDYNESTNNWNSLTAYSTGSTDLMGVGKGYAVWPDVAGVVSFTGTLQSGSQSRMIVRTGDNGWNCIGNPYTSTIAINSNANSSTNFIGLNSSNIDASHTAVYVWNQSTGVYTIYNQSSEAYYAPVGQGFFVKAAATGNIGFTSAMQSHQTGVTLRGASVIPKITVQASLSDKQSLATVKLMENTTSGLDVGYDAGVMKTGFDVYTRLVEDNGVDFGIQCVPVETTASYTIPVGLETTAGGTIELQLNALDMPAGYTITFEDALSGTSTEMDASVKVLTVDVSAGTVIDRFSLKVRTTVTSLKNISEDPTVVTRSGEICLYGAKAGTASLYDLQGRCVRSIDLTDVAMNRISTNGVTGGVYLLRIRQQERVSTRKIVVQ